MNTIERLINKANEVWKMPSLKSIHILLIELDIKHDFTESLNIVEYSSWWNRYVNSRHEWKKGYLIKHIDWHYIWMDTSGSYYSWNSWNYARKILSILYSLWKIDYNKYKDWK